MPVAHDPALGSRKLTGTSEGIGGEKRPPRAYYRQCSLYLESARRAYLWVSVHGEQFR
jgi:hypothetical protein